MKHTNKNQKSYLERVILSKYISYLCSKYKVYLVALSVTSILGSFFGICVNYMVKEIIDFIAKNPTQDVLVPLCMFILFDFAHHGIYFVTRLFDVKYKPEILTEIVHDMYSKTVHHSLHWFDSHLSGEISSKINDFVESIITIITVIKDLIGQIAVVVIGTAFLFTVNTSVGFLMFVFVVIYFPIVGLLLKKQLDLQGEYVKARQEAVGIINDSIVNIFGIKIIGNMFAELTNKFTPSVKKWSNWDRKTRKFDAYFVDNANTILVVAMMSGQIWLLSHLYKIGQISSGDFVFVSMMMMYIGFVIDRVLEGVLFNLNPKIATIKSSYEFINQEIDVVDIKSAKIMPRINGNITYNDVTFGYSESEDILRKFNLRLKQGEKIGIIGTSGAGKTTFIKCLLRYFNLRGGRILVDGYDITEVTQDSLRANISVIPQDITMFHRSIVDNLLLAKHDATIEEIKMACKKARIHDDIEKMRDGYNSIVGERGVKLSGGQRQRIAIARAILKNAPILILDEATSALDTHTEKLVQASIEGMLEETNATIIAIAHRLSTILHMDRILVFDKGRIIEDGTHQELLIKNGAYKSLWDAQVGGFIS